MASTNRAFTRLWQTRSVRRLRYGVSPRRWLRYLSAGKRRMPDYIIAGAQKAGTTSLHGYLLGHPCVAPSMHKEVHFFDKNFHRGLDWYRMHFPVRPAVDDAAGPTLCGESSPYYMCHPLVPARMAELLPQVRVIMLLRHPVDRAWSHYQHNVRRVREPLSFEEAIDEEAIRLVGEVEKLQADPAYQSFAHQKFSYLARGIYADQLAVWRACFPQQQLMFIESRELFCHPEQVFDRVLKFLELPSWAPDEYENLNVGRYKERMSPETRAKLLEYFAPYNERLYAALGQRFEWDR